MVVMFAAGIANLAWMAPLAALMCVEKATSWGKRLVALAGVALVALGALSLGHPIWFPALLGGP
jgi:predicted metal-binding membrane protein